MKRIHSLFLIILSLILSTSVFAQKHTISGYIEDASNGEKLIAVNIFDSNSALGAVSNTYGFYSLTLEQDSVLLGISYVGYQTQFYKLYLDKDVSLNFKLSSDVELETVEVVSDRVEKIEERTQMSTVSVPIEQIKKIPALLGEVDVLKALQLLPGVQSGGEGQSGLYVRGGSPDQNLILLDGVPVYNASHLFGFFSVFNADAIKDVTLTKGGFPARYGGRLSSVIEINMKEGNTNEFHGTGSIGLISSKLTLEGPIIKDKTSFLISGRRTYIDLLARPIIKNAFEEGGSSGNAGYYFYDVNGKINHKFSDKDRLYFSVYTGRDKFYFSERFQQFDYDSESEVGLGWGNLTSALRYNHLWSNKLFSNLTLTYSRYNFDTELADRTTYSNNGVSTKDNFEIGYLSGIDDIAAKIDFDYVPNPNHYIRFGTNIIHHNFDPGAFKIKIESTGVDDFLLDTLFGQSKVDAQEFAFYVEDDMRIGSKLKVNAGVHFSGFNVKSKVYTSVQPRLSVRYLLPNDIALKGSYASMRQYIQLLTNESIGLPTDLWVPTTETVLPQDSWQVALGVAKTFDKKYEFSVEGYYKQMKNIISYKEGASLFNLDDWQSKVTQGDGESYGAEFLVQKKKGRLTGWVGYTLSWSWRQFDDLNFGNRYSFKYDRRHDLSVVASYELSDRIQFSATWVYGTGNAVTLANSVYNGFYPVSEFSNDFTGWYPNDFNAEYYQDRNNFRMRSYHRFDVGVDFIKQKKRFKRTWSVGAYNLYNRKNPFFLYTDREVTFDNNGNLISSKKVLKQASLFPIIPSVAYKFEF